MNLRLADTISYAALRIVCGFAFSLHGWQKMFGLFGQPPADESQMAVGGVIELACGTMMALGLLTRANAFLASGTMAVAYIQFHWKLAFDDKFFPLVNHGELALVYCFLFLLFAARGSGPVSIDRLIFGRESKLAGTN